MLYLQTSLFLAQSLANLLPRAGRVSIISLMRFVAIILLCSFQFLGFAKATQVESFGQALKVEYTHTHDHSDDHEHAVNNHNDHHAAANTTSEKSHTHEFYVVGQVLFIPSFLGADSFLQKISISYSADHHQVPQDPYLRGIFRPPILG